MFTCLHQVRAMDMRKLINANYTHECLSKYVFQCLSYVGDGSNFQVHVSNGVNVNLKRSRY